MPYKAENWHALSHEQYLLEHCFLDTCQCPLKSEIKIKTINWCLFGLRLKMFELNALPAYDDRYIKTKIRTYSDKVYSNFCHLNVPEDDIECESFTVIYIDSLVFYKHNHYLQRYLDNCAYKYGNKQTTDYLDHNLFKTD